MYHPTTRVLAVLALLQAHGRMSGSELAQRLEVNIRTLRRYIIMLQDLGIPIEAERGRNGAYVLSAGFKLPQLDALYMEKMKDTGLQFDFGDGVVLP